LTVPAHAFQAAVAGMPEASPPKPVPSYDDDSPAQLTLDEHGMICDCNRAAEILFKCRRSDLVWRHTSVLVPQLAEFELMQDGQPNARLRYYCRVGRLFRAVTHDGGSFEGELFLNVLDCASHGRLSLIVRPATAATCDLPDTEVQQ
jgi:hypothetical protein